MARSRPLERLESALEGVPVEESSTEPSATEPSTDSPLFRVARALFGGILVLLAVDNLRNIEERVQYAESKGVPRSDTAVPASSVGLLTGGIGVALWRAPAVAAAAVIAFFAGVTPFMHDFWNVDDPQQRQQEFFHFLKNAALLGATVAFLNRGLRERRRI